MILASMSGTSDEGPWPRCFRVTPTTSSGAGSRARVTCWRPRALEIARPGSGTRPLVNTWRRRRRVS